MAWQNHGTGTTTGNFGTGTSTAQPNWLPEVFSQKVQVAFRKSAVVQAVTNTEYFGEIAGFGDTVNIIKEPQITIDTGYTRADTGITTTQLTDDELVLKINYTSAFKFEIDDLERRFSHIGWQDVASNNAAYKIKDSMDSRVLAGIVAGTEGAVSTTTSIGSDTTATLTALPAASGGVGGLQLGYAASGQVKPVDLLGRLARLLDDNDVPGEDRWVVAAPAFYEHLAKEESNLMSTDFNAGLGSLRNGLVQEGKVRGFTMYVSNNLPSPTNTSVLLHGHMSAVASAEAYMKTEVLRSTAVFKDIIRGLHVFGYKVLRDVAVGKVYYDLV